VQKYRRFLQSWIFPADVRYWHNADFLQRQNYGSLTPNSGLGQETFGCRFSGPS